jgi:acyl-CoA reductase-like NAD-dependent aldehyde dehydrogenase
VTSSIVLRNPATTDVIRELELADAAAVDRAVARAAAAGPGWRATAPADRARLMRRFADTVAAHADELAAIETANMGMPVGNSTWCANAVADVLHYFAGAVDKHTGATIPVAGGVNMTFHEPLGVVGLITPWNFPMLMASWKIGPALAAGNTAVLKPAEITPLTTMRIAELALEAGIPEGVLNVVVGTGADAGWRLVEHPTVRKVAFTGSTAVGKRIMAGCAEQVKRVTLELGGKSANIVFADAEQHLARVRSFTDGLDTVFTGSVPDGPGYWHPVMIALAADQSARICRDEVFGPVAVVIPFDDEADAIRLCNDSEYGLSGSIWTGDGSRAMRVARAMEAGTISVNSNSSVRYSTPFGGFKQSGLGREHSMTVLDHYTELKNVFVATGV